jgi:hypothetical protein
VKLTPTIPPGRPNRKARAFSAEIARLVMEGYSCKAIHQALTDAGVLVSKSTVQREVARLARPTPPAARQVEARPVVPRPPPPVVETNPLPETTRHWPADGEQSSKDFAAEFMKGRVTNPLLRNRS